MKKLWLLLGAVVILGLVVCAKPKGAIEVKSTPEGAAVYLDGDDTGEKTNIILADLEPDDYTVKLVLEGYDDYEEAVTVEGGDTVLVEAVLVANAFGALQVNSTPDGAAIELDGTATGKVTNHLFDSLAIGSHTLKLTLAEYKDWDTTVTIIKDSTLTVNAVLVLKTGSIQVNSEPDGAEIWLDGVDKETVTDALLEEVPIGERIVKLVLEGYKDWDTTVTVNEDETTTIDAVLEEAPQEEVELKEDEAIPLEWSLILSPGYRLAVKFTPPAYPFEITQAAYAPWNWEDGWGAAVKLLFYAGGASGPGTELASKTVAAASPDKWNWFDVTDLDNRTINSGDFYCAVEMTQNRVPFFIYDGGAPLHHVSWFYPPSAAKWYNWDNVNVIDPNGDTLVLGEEADMMIRVKGYIPGGAKVVLTPTVVQKAPHSVSSDLNAAPRDADVKKSIIVNCRDSR